MEKQPILICLCCGGAWETLDVDKTLEEWQGAVDALIDGCIPTRIPFGIRLYPTGGIKIMHCPHCSVRRKG
jgi:hypothetical protein